MKSTTANQQRKLGTAGPESFPIALGCMGMSGMYGPSNEKESIATIHEALERGINLLDTGDFYGFGHNEMLINRAIQGRRQQVLLSVKFGALRAPGGAWTGFDSRPSSVKNFLVYSLTRLGVDYIDIYRPSRLDPQVPIEETMGTLSQMVKAGYIRHIGLSEVGPQTIRRAHSIHPVSDLQIEYSVMSRGPEAKIFPTLQELGIGVTAYGLLSRGVLSSSKPAPQGDHRNYLPRFTAENQAKNQRLIDRLREIAQEKGTTVTQLAIAWALHKAPSILPVLGSRTRNQLRETLGALDIVLTSEDLLRIEESVPASEVAGTRYDAHQMSVLDSEQPTRD